MVPEQPSIHLLGLRIDEPITTLTDLMVSGVCLYAFFKTNKLKQTKVMVFLKYYFLSMAAATAIGGIIGHAFFYAFNFYWKLPGWLTSMFSVALLERACIEKVRTLIKPQTGKAFAIINTVELITFVILTFTTLNFFFVEAHSAYGLLVVVSSFSFYNYRKTKNNGSKLFIYGVAVSAISALFYMNEWSLHMWFNYLDISHVFMTFAAYLFYRGALKIDKDD